MAKRLTDTEKWERPWFRNLPAKYKLLWCHILDRCDIAGVWYVDLELASFLIGEVFPREEAEQVLDKQIKIKNGRWLVKDFIQFQYGNLSPSNKLHNNVQMRLQAFGKGASIPHQSPIDGVKDKDKDKDICISYTYSSVFAALWKEYPRPLGKAEAEKHFKASVKTDQDVLDITKALNNYKAEVHDKEVKYIKHGSRWFNPAIWRDYVDIKPKEVNVGVWGR